MHFSKCSSSIPLILRRKLWKVPQPLQNHCPSRLQVLYSSASRQHVHSPPGLSCIYAWAWNSQLHANWVQAPLPPVKINGEPEYEISEVLDLKIDWHHGPYNLFYLVQWSGYEGTCHDPNSTDQGVSHIWKCFQQNPRNCSQIKPHLTWMHAMVSQGNHDECSITTPILTHRIMFHGDEIIT